MPQLSHCQAIKAAGIDGIPAEFYKANPNQAACLLQPLIHEARINESLPNEWTDGIIVEIPKKGNLHDCDNWRDICILPVVSKMIAKVMLERIRDLLISTVDAEQAGFRAGSSHTDHINSVRIIIEQCKEFRSGLHMILIDSEKAFDSVNRDCIWQALGSRAYQKKA